MADVRKNPPDYITISPMTVACPKCKAAAGTPCDVLNEFELIHLERIYEADAMGAANKSPPN